MKKIILSGINFTEGGPLTIYKECLKYLEENLLNRYEVTALVHDRNLFSEFTSVNFIEFRKSKKSYFMRLYYEYFVFNRLSKKLNPYLWFSLHDMTPNVKAERRAVYCHNAMMFYKVERKKILKEFKMYLFSRFYKYVYKINIKKNNFVVVQQDWMRERFRKLFGVENIIVAYPEVNFEDLEVYENIPEEKNTFIFPSFPRIFKNFEIICEAVKKLENENIKNFKVYLTLKGNENAYAKEIYNTYKDLKCVKFTGLLKREELKSYYSRAECVIFPSKLETWGLPITEAKAFKKTLLLADLDYARETLGEYEKVFFFNPESSDEMVSKMKSIILRNHITYEGNVPKKVLPPHCHNWKELFSELLGEKKDGGM